MIVINLIQLLLIVNNKIVMILVMILIMKNMVNRKKILMNLIRNLNMLKNEHFFKIHTYFFNYINIIINIHSLFVIINL